MTVRHLVLVGMMGAGKTSVGRRCAARLDRRFVDTDQLVESTAGTSVAEIFETQGEPAFRELERAAVADACASLDPLVIACGGGAVLDPANRTALKAAGFVIWLQAPSSVLGDRVRPQGSARPLIASVRGATPVETLDRIAVTRESMYRDVADRAVDTSAFTVDQVADTVVRIFEDAAP